MPINILSESGAYDPSPSQLWEQDQQASTTVARSLFRLPTSGLGSLLNSFGGAPSVSYSTLRQYVMPNALDFFLTEGLVYFHHIIDTSNQPFVAGTLTPGFPPVLVSTPVCGIGVGPDIGYANNGAAVSQWSAAGMWCSTAPSNGTMYGTPGATQAVRGTYLRPAEGRNASGRVGGYPELFCIDSSTSALMVQLLPGGRDPIVGEQINWTTNLASSYSGATGAISAYRFSATYSLARSNYSFSARVVEFYKIPSLGYHMLQLSGNMRFTADQVINFNGLNFKVVAGGGIPTRAALFGRWEFDRKEVYWVKMKASDEYLTRGKIYTDPTNTNVTPDVTLRSNMESIFTGGDANAAARLDSNPVTRMFKDNTLAAFPEQRPNVGIQAPNVQHGFTEIDTTDENIDPRTPVSSNAVPHLNNASISSSNYSNLGPVRTSNIIQAPDQLPTGEQLISGVGNFREKITENIDNTNTTTKNLAVDGLNSSSDVNGRLNERSNIETGIDLTSKKTKIYGPVKRFDLVPVYQHPEYTTLQRYDPDERRDRTFNFTFTLDLENMSCGPCVCIVVTTPGETDPVTGETGPSTTEIITCDVAATPTDVSFPVKKVILNNLTPEANIWKQITKNYNGSLQGIVYGNLVGRNTGTSDPASAREGDSYYNTRTNKSRIYLNGSWVDQDQADLGPARRTRTEIQLQSEEPVLRRDEMNQLLDDMSGTGTASTRNVAKSTLRDLENNSKNFNSRAREINNRRD
jgi:hypothetical protein